MIDIISRRKGKARYLEAERRITDLHQAVWDWKVMLVLHLEGSMAYLLALCAAYLRADSIIVQASVFSKQVIETHDNLC